jgi:predicted transporter
VLRPTNVRNGGTYVVMQLTESLVVLILFQITEIIVRSRSQPMTLDSLSLLVTLYFTMLTTGLLHFAVCGVKTA